MITTEAIILAGGLGSRLQKVVSDRPKPMAEINGRPFLEYLLDYLISQGITKAILAVGFKHEFIQHHFGNTYKHIDLRYAVEEQQLGTGGGLVNALRIAESEEVFIVNGDTYFPVSFHDMEETFIREHADLVIALHPVRDAGRYGTILLHENGRIARFCEKGGEMGRALINGGIYLMKSQLLLSAALPEKFSLETEFLEIKSGEMRFFGRVFKNRFIDIGIPASYHQAQSFFERNSNEK